DMIHESVMAYKPKTMQDAIKFETELIDKKISTFAECQDENKRKLNNNNKAQQQPPKKKGATIAYTAEPGERKEYDGILSLCNKCKFHHNGQALMFPEELDKIEKYVSGFLDMIHESVMAYKPKTMQDAIKFETELIDKKISTFAECQDENKRKLNNNNKAQQQPPKKKGATIAYTAEPGERKEYDGILSLCNKCKFHHNGQAL
nr:hypothetical protein [Tanacetum cinerariifolium]